MSGVTVPLGFPYPDDADLVQGVDEAIQALAEAADDAITGTDTVAAAAANVTIPAGNNVFKRGRSGVLAMSGWTLTAAKAAGAQIATIPAGYRPLVDVYFVVYNHAGVTFNFGVVQPSGAVLIGNAAASGNVLYTSVVLPL